MSPSAAACIHGPSSPAPPPPCGSPTPATSCITSLQSSADPARPPNPAPRSSGCSFPQPVSILRSIGSGAPPTRIRAAASAANRLLASGDVSTLLHAASTWARISSARGRWVGSCAQHERAKTARAWRDGHPDASLGGDGRNGSESQHTAA